MAHWWQRWRHRLGHRDSTALVADGDQLLADGHPAAARECYELALARQPDSPPALLGLGQAWRATGDLLEAATCFARACELDRGCRAAWEGWGWALLEAGHDSDAVDAWREVVRLAPAEAEPARLYGVALRRARRLEEAAAALLHALELAPENPDIWYDYGTCLVAAGRPAEASAALARYAGLAREDHPRWEAAQHVIDLLSRQAGSPTAGEMPEP